MNKTLSLIFICSWRRLEKVKKHSVLLQKTYSYDKVQDFVVYREDILSQITFQPHRNLIHPTKTKQTINKQTNKLPSYTLLLYVTSS